MDIEFETIFDLAPKTLIYSFVRKSAEGYYVFSDETKEDEPNMVLRAGKLKPNGSQTYTCEDDTEDVLIVSKEWVNNNAVEIANNVIGSYFETLMMAFLDYQNKVKEVVDNLD